MAVFQRKSAYRPTVLPLFSVCRVRMGGTNSAGLTCGCPVPAVSLTPRGVVVELGVVVVDDVRQRDGAHGLGCGVFDPLVGGGERGVDVSRHGACLSLVLVDADHSGQSIGFDGVLDVEQRHILGVLDQACADVAALDVDDAGFF